MKGTRAAALLGFALACAVFVGILRGQAAAPTQSERAPADDPVGQLEARVAGGSVSIERNDRYGYLPTVLRELGINADSQLLVFSKASFQGPLISASAPRAIYFTDNAAVGVVQNAPFYELVGVDPVRGLQFYTLDMQKPSPRFERGETECAQCHGLVNTFGLGLIVTSSPKAPDGVPWMYGAGMFNMTDHRTPIAERWGGWYLTGTHGAIQHLGNATTSANSSVTDTLNVVDLSKRFDTSRYLTGTSDLVAMMTFEHQVRMTNLLVSLGAISQRQGGGGSDNVQRLEGRIEELVRYMLFADEAPLVEPVHGVSTFTQTFPARGPRDSKGRSLRDFDLQHRLFKYPLSYLIYSSLFDALPDAVRTRIYARLHEVLSGEDRSAQFARLSNADREAITDIVRATKTNLPEGW